MNINERVKAVRNALGLTQIEFGQKTGISQGHLTSIESSKRSVTDKSIKVICLQFNVNEEWLRTGEGEMFLGDDDSLLASLVAEYDLDDLDAQILDIYIHLPKEQRHAVKAFLLAFGGAVQEGKVKSIDEFMDSGNETVRVFRAAKSKTNKPGGYVDVPRSLIEKLEAAEEADEL